MQNLPQILPPTPQPAPALAVSSPGSANAVPPCFGLGCQLRRTCANYHAIEGGDPCGSRMSNCGPEHAAYEAVVPV